MKRILCLLLAASFVLLTGCFGGHEKEGISSENSEPTSSEPMEEPSSAPSEESPGSILVSLPPMPNVRISVGSIVNVVEGSYVNVRSVPDQGSEAIGRAVSGEKYLVDPEGSSSDWVKVTYQGQSGFIFHEYISVAG